MKTYSTFLPVFTGFYCNYNYEINLANEIDFIHGERKSNNLPTLTDIELDVDTTKFESDVAKALCDYVETEFNYESDTKISIKFEKVNSPNGYNFTNDIIDCEIGCDLEKLLQICNDNKDSFEAYIKDNYTDYDGFWSNHSNLVSDWLDIDYINEKSEHRVGVILEFICKELYQIEEPCLSELDIYDSEYITNSNYWLELNPFNENVIVCSDLKNFEKACYWFRNWSGLSDSNFDSNIETLSIKFIENLSYIENKILIQLETSGLIDFKYRLESLDEYDFA